MDNEEKPSGSQDFAARVRPPKSNMPEKAQAVPPPLERNALDVEQLKALAEAARERRLKRGGTGYLLEEHLAPNKSGNQPRR